ncbi:MAG: nucleotide-diphospho-sugar transferase [Flavobacteriales bacterium]
MSDTSAPPTSARTAVLFLTFNRPDTTMEVFAAIRQARPPRLYIASDGARAERAGEAALVSGLREAMLAKVNWPCEVRTLFRDANLGCRSAVSGAISWFFTHEERGIILEDDCLPSPSFFPFCEGLLERYATDTTVAGITGDYRPQKSEYGPDTYGRVGYPLIWGWASWRRVWDAYDANIAAWNGEPEDYPRMADRPKATRQYLKLVFDAVQDGKLDTWDFQFNFQCQLHQQDFLHPHVNLITNIGFTDGATHTSDPNDPNAALPREEVLLPLRKAVDGREYDAWLDKKVFAVSSIRTKAMNRIYRWYLRRRSVT